MGEQDEAGRAEALPPPLVLPPPPDVVLLDFLLPPQPAATSARITATAASAPTNSRLFTLPPPSRNGRAERALDPHRGRKYPTTLRLIATPNRLYDRKVVNLLPLDHRLWPWLADTMAGAEVAELADAPEGGEEPMVPPRAPSFKRFSANAAERSRAKPASAPGYDGPGRSGGTGRRAGLKIRWGKPRVGSIPTFGMRCDRPPVPGFARREAHYS